METLMKYVFWLIYLCDKKAGEKNTQLKKHLLFLFKVYYSLSVDYCREREKKFLFREILIIFSGVWGGGVGGGGDIYNKFH